MIKKISVLFFIFFIAVKLTSAQSYSRFDSYVSSQIEQLKSELRSKGFEPVKEQNITLLSDKIYPVELNLQGNLSYCISLITENLIDASAIELQDEKGDQIKYVKKIIDPENNMVNLIFTSSYSGKYKILFKAINNKKSFIASYMMLWKNRA